MSADIRTIKGETISAPIPAVTPLSVLKDLVAKIESGDLPLEDILVLGILPSKTDPSMHVYRSWDNGMTLAQAVHTMESCKFDLILAARGFK